MNLVYPQTKGVPRPLYLLPLLSRKQFYLLTLAFYIHCSHKPQDIQHPEVSFSYSMEWKDKLIDSSQFYIQNGHYNPKYTL